MKTLIFSVLSVLSLASCSTLESTTSAPRNAEAGSELYYLDSDSQIRYLVANDHDTLFLKLLIEDRNTMAMMMRQGSSVYFDLNGKKKKKVYVRYPLREPMQEPMQGQMQAGMGRGAGGGEKPDQAAMLESIPKDILYVNNGEEELIQPSELLPSDISCSYSVDKANSLVYELKIPFYRIAEQGLASIEQLSIGIVAEAMERPSSMEGGRQGGMGGGSMGGGRSGGMGGGSMGGGSMGGGRPGGMGGGRSGGSGQGDMNRQAMSSSVEFWFLVDLYRE